MTLVICGWCRESFDMVTTKGPHGYGNHSCPYCFSDVRSSRKEEITDPGSRTHIHMDLKKGDVV